MKQSIITIILTILFSHLFSQEYNIKGKIISVSDNSPLEGALITLSGTKTTVYSNRLGQFSMRTNLKDSVAITISHVGYKPLQKTISLPSGQELLFLLTESANALDEVTVVSTGYQQISKDRSTGSFSTVSKELLNQQISTDILSRLTVANSVMFDNSQGGKPQLMVRGLSTIRGPKDPLIIIDHFPFEGDISNINPNMVENITVLKDAAAASIWGARAANGVIIITTKKAALNQHLSVELNSNLSIMPKPDFSDAKIMSSGNFIDVETELFKRGFYNSQITAANRPVISPVVDLLDKARNGIISQDYLAEKINKLKQVNVLQQFKDLVYKPAVNQQYFLNVNGGSQSFSWLAAIGYDANKDNLNNTYDRFSLRLQNNYHISKRLSVTTNLLYTQAINNSGKTGLNDLVMKAAGVFTPYTKLADESGNPLVVPRIWNQSFIDTFGNGRLLNWNYYPLDDWQYNRSKKDQSGILLNAIIKYRLFRDLDININYQYQKQITQTTNLAGEKSYFTRDYINRFTQLTNQNILYIVPKGAILDNTLSNLLANNIRVQLNYDKNIHLFNINAIAGSEMRFINEKSSQGRTYGFNTDNYTTGQVDFTKMYPNIITGGNAFIANNNGIEETNTRFISQYFNTAISYDKKYTLSASLRRDASNLFGLNINDQWNPFWSLGIAWNMTREPFFKNVKETNITWRVTYGQNGNINPAMVAVNTIQYFSANSPLTGTRYARFSNYYNPDLKWETTKMFNIGLDFSLLKHRINGSLEFYNKNADNLFGMSTIDYTTGIDPNLIKNVASMNGRGVDITLKTLNINKAVKWHSVINVNFNKDKVVEYKIARTLAREYIANSSVPVSGISGHPVYSIYAYKWAGLDDKTGEAQGFLNGEISKNYSSLTGTGTSIEALEHFGSAIPTIFGSFINMLNFKNINLQIGLNYKLGYWMRSRSVNYTDLFNSWSVHSDYSRRWQKTGDELVTNVPAINYTTNSLRDNFYAGATVNVHKADHIRLQYINLSYDFKGRHTKARLIQLFLNASNLGLIWKANKINIDPDFNMGNSYSLKTPPSFTFGFRSNF